MRKRSFAPPLVQEFQGNSANRRDAASRPKRSKRPVSDKPMPPRSGKPRRLLELGKLRKAVSMRQEHGIQIDAHKWARAVAMLGVGTGEADRSRPRSVVPMGGHRAAARCRPYDRLRRVAEVEVPQVACPVRRAHGPRPSRAR